MATKFDSEYAPSPTNNESEDENYANYADEQDTVAPTNNVADILKRLQSSGALLKKPKQEFRCFTCEEDFVDWEELENHLIQHVSLPSIVLHKLQSEDEESIHSGDENWSDEEETVSTQAIEQKKTPQKIDISQILKKTGISIKKPAENSPNNSALDKLSGLGFTIKKNSTPIKQEKSDSDKQNPANVMQKLGQLGGIKLTLKSDGNNSNTFKVINGLKDFKTSDDEDFSENEDSKGDLDEFEDDQGSGIEQACSDNKPNTIIRKSTGSDSSEKEPPKNRTIIGPNVQGSLIVSNTETISSGKLATQQVKPSGRPAIKQTPKRGANLPMSVRESPLIQEITTSKHKIQQQSGSGEMDNVVVKKEVDPGVGDSPGNMPLFSGQIKSERVSPPPSDPNSTPVLATVKSEPESVLSAPQSSQQLFSSLNPPPASTTPLLPVTKTEDSSMTIIEINGDSNDEDDDCCVVSATPAPDIKPVIPKVENVSQSYSTSTSFPLPQPNYSSSSLSSQMSGLSSTEKQHNFDWNAPDSKPTIDLFEKSTDDIFQSLLSSTKKENLSLSEASEYISLDTLGPQQTCDVCNTRFTDISLLEDHRRTTGHSKSIVTPSSSSILPYNQSPSILSSLLPVKQLAEQVGKLSGMGNSGPGFTHQQNVMINIQAYPGAGGVMGPPPAYNSYPPVQNMHSGYSQPDANMYGVPGQTMPGQYPGQSYMGPSAYGQQTFQPKSPQYPQHPYGTTPMSSAYSATTPLQNMQQAVYGQTAGLMNTQQQMGQMGPPPSPYVPASSPSGTIKPLTSAASGIKIQNVQTFPPGQLVGPTLQTMSPGQATAPGQVVGGQMPAPNQIRMAANVSGPRPRMSTVRGAKPSIRPGIQVHGQIRGAKPGIRMPLKRPQGIVGGPAQKRRPDMLLPGKHDNEDCQVMAMQKQREGLPMIHSVQGAKDKLNIGSQISITKKTVSKQASAMAMLASRGISIKQKQKSRSPSPDRPLPYIPNLGSGVSIKHASKSGKITIPETKFGMTYCKICKKAFNNQNSLAMHMASAHAQSKIPMFKCDECPASYPKSLQLQHHKRVFHNVSGPDRELGLPVVDLSQDDTVQRLSSLGIYSYIPLANKEQSGGCFGIPVVAVRGDYNRLSNCIQALGADGLLSLGPLKSLPNT